ncbi:30S ribosomal protein S3 [bacterium]|nr:30S ribosomal protein S3 [bacterium]MCK5598441.1 30S ribosomal protein S3 [bacterium]
MGQKVNPEGFRVGITKNWSSRWFNEKNYAKNVINERGIENFIRENYKDAGIGRIIFERKGTKQNKIRVFVVRPAFIIGQKGTEIKKLTTALKKKWGEEYKVEISEIIEPNLDANIVAQNVANQLARRMHFKRVIKKTALESMARGAKGIKMRIAGRIAGSEMARIEWEKKGRIPLHTLRANIEYAYVASRTSYGIIGVKVWLYKGDVKSHKELID